MASTAARSRKRFAPATAVLAALVAPTGCGRSGPPPSTPKTTPADAPVAGSLSITSPAFADGSAIPTRFSCHGDNIAPPLAWSAPAGAAGLALVVDDPDAPGGSYVHWIVVDIAPGPGRTTDGQVPDNGRSLNNSSGNGGYFGPCPPAGSGTHHYRFTLYQLAAASEPPSGSAGVQAAQAIAHDAAAQARLTGTFQG
jgi:Raf kinase inhibitor-like YbhB/YbcL family protein